jgi:hypothetical protein
VNVKCKQSAHTRINQSSPPNSINFANDTVRVFAIHLQSPYNPGTDGSSESIATVGQVAVEGCHQFHTHSGYWGLTSQNYKITDKIKTIQLDYDNHSTVTATTQHSTQLIQDCGSQRQAREGARSTVSYNNSIKTQQSHAKSRRRCNRPETWRKKRDIRGERHYRPKDKKKYFHYPVITTCREGKSRESFNTQETANHEVNEYVCQNRNLQFVTQTPDTSNQ